MDPNSNFDPHYGFNPQQQYPSYDDGAATGYMEEGPSASYAYNVANAQHMQQGNNYGAVETGAFGGQSYDNNNMYYSGDQYSSNHQHLQQASDESGYYSYQPDQQQVPTQTEQSVAAGELYPIESIPIQLSGAPVSALAYDTAYEAVFVASETQSLTRGRFNHRASMLMTYATNDGMLYSSVAGHPEAPPLVLKKLYGAMYSTGTNVVNSVRTNRRPIPNHAFQPTYGDADPALPDSTTLTFQMGIRDLLPIGEGYVSSVSAAGVRIHAHGGLQTADFHTEGMLAMTAHPNQGVGSAVTHVTAGGMALQKDVSQNSGRSDVLCLDIYQGLRVIASYTTSAPSGGLTGIESKVAITALDTSHARGSVIAGGSDGRVRVLDSRLREVASIRSHLGGVVDLAVSSDGNLLATCGYGSRGSSSPPLYSFPDPNIYCYDLRYLGRGGIPHPFAGLGGGPRHLSFLPDIDGVEPNRLMAVSGRVGGGIQVIVPFEEASQAGSFVSPQLDHGESITAMHLNDGIVGLGTSKGNLLQYRISEYKNKNPQSVTPASGIFIPQDLPGKARTKAQENLTTSVQKKGLQMPSFNPPMPELSLNSKMLLKGNNGGRNGPNDKLKSIFSAYVLGREPTVSSVKERSDVHFGPLGSDPMVGGSKNELSESLIEKTTHSVSDFVRSLAASELKLELLQDHRPEWVTSRLSKSREQTRANPNKFLYQSNLYTQVYRDSFNRFKKRGRRTGRAGQNDKNDAGLMDIPARYRLPLRPTHKSAAVFSHSEHNDTGLFPGWDYPQTMPNAFVPPVLMLLYFFPEARAILLSQFADKAAFGKKDGLISELSFVFHRIDCIARQALIFPLSAGVSPTTKLGAWSPTNFVTCLATTAEAEQLQILDGSPAAVESPRRPEAFYRFLLYQIDKELGKGVNAKMIDKIGGVDFISVNEFISQSTAPTTSSTRAMTVDLYYENFVDKGDAPKELPSFGEVLYRTLSRETRLRAFNQSSGSYETIVQRKIATSLPSVLSLSCACAGRREEEGLFVWRGNSSGQDHWLPEKLEVEITDNGNILVSEYIKELGSGTGRWVKHGVDDAISSAVADILANRKGQGAQKMRYELTSVVSLVRDDLDRNIPDELISAKGDDGGSFGHHVLHTKIPESYHKRVVDWQIDEAKQFTINPKNPHTIVSAKDEDVINKRAETSSLRRDSPGGWVLFNGFNVSKTSAEDARAFHVHFKEPCIVVYRSSEADDEVDETQSTVPADVICTRSLTNNTKSEFHAMQKPNMIPTRGDLVAFDAEFVSLQEEVSALTEAGSKITIQETRHALARISAVACNSKNVIFDDFVTPGEDVADYLTRFSGIVERDLDPKESNRHLISTRAAYLKLRCLVERGCIFVGHGLDRDFWTSNLMVPANQIIDTVLIYHKPAQRYVSLRFLANFVLKRDMQQEVHDSLEDATAAFELYEIAAELKQQGEFAKLLDDIYEYGQKVDWKLGIE